MNLRKRAKFQSVDVSRPIDPKKPTESYPGSPEKIEVLRERNAIGLPLWHPLDRNDHGPHKETRNREFAA
ncbi:MAG: hypothetical protein VX435_11455 [Planctomycetota bacterium]|nr:hypothetical protein [Planctomycetota bacterium]